MQLTFV